MSKPTLKLLLSRIEAWADSHIMITEFGHGQLPDMEKKRRTEWTMLFLVVQDPRILKHGVEYSLDFIVAAPTQANPDSTQADFDSVKQTQSDLLQIVQDFCAEIRNGSSYFYEDDEPLFEFPDDSAVSALPFLEDHAQWITGWNAQITLQTADPLNQCVVPYLGAFIPTPPPAGDCFPFTLDYDEETFLGGTDFDLTSASQILPTSKVTIQRDGSTFFELIVGLDESQAINVPSVCADGTVVLKKSNGTTTLRSVTVGAGGSVDETIAVSAVTINSDAFASVEAEDPLSIEVVDAADSTTQVGSLVGGKWEVVVTVAQRVRFNTVQTSVGTSSIANYDAPWQFVNGYLNPTHPSNATILQELNGNRKVLLYDNEFGNKDRFTLTSGVAAGNNVFALDTIHIDHLHGLDVVMTDASSAIWLNTLQDPTAALGAHGTGWRLPTLQEMTALASFINNQQFINLPVKTSTTYWSSTYLPSDSTKAYQTANNTTGFTTTAAAITGSRNYFYVRNRTYA